MKINDKILIFLFLLIFILIGNTNNSIADNNNLELVNSVPRVILVELFVQTICTTCPHAEFCLEDLFWQYGYKKLILVQEHLWGDGYDTPETNARYAWYVGEGIKGTPDVFINGLAKRVQGLACEDIDENYLYYKELIDFELAKPASIEISVSKTMSNYIEAPHQSNHLPQGKSGSKVVIEGRIKNVGTFPLENIAVCGMIYKKGAETGLCCWVRDILPFQNILLLTPGETFDFSLVSEPLIQQEGDDKLFHTIVFVQDVNTKEVLQALYVE